LLLWTITDLDFDACLEMDKESAIEIFKEEKPMIADCLCNIISNGVKGE
jgi:hypothetical protein